MIDRTLRLMPRPPTLAQPSPRSLFLFPVVSPMSAGAYHETQTHCCREDPCGLPSLRAAGHSCFRTSPITLHLLPSRARLPGCPRPLAPGVRPTRPLPHPLPSQAQRCTRVAAWVSPRSRGLADPNMCAAPPLTAFASPPPQHLPHTRSPDRSHRRPCMTAVHEDQNVQKAEVQTATAVRRPSRGDWRRRACRCHNIGREEYALAARPRETPLINGQSTPRTSTHATSICPPIGPPSLPRPRPAHARG